MRVYEFFPAKNYFKINTEIVFWFLRDLPHCSSLNRVFGSYVSVMNWSTHCCVTFEGQSYSCKDRCAKTYAVQWIDKIWEEVCKDLTRPFKCPATEIVLRFDFWRVFQKNPERVSWGFGLKKWAQKTNCSGAILTIFSYKISGAWAYDFYCSSQQAKYSGYFSRIFDTIHAKYEKWMLYW